MVIYMYVFKKCLKQHLIKFREESLKINFLKKLPKN